MNKRWTGYQSNTTPADYVAKCCPHLIRAECEAVADDLLDNYRPDEIYPNLVEAHANTLFPYVKKQVPLPPIASVAYLNGRHQVLHAMQCVDQAASALAKCAYKSDDVARTELILREAYTALDTEQEAMATGELND